MRYKILILTVAALLVGGRQVKLVAQNINLGAISEIAKNDPLIITGAVGTQNTYYYSSVGNGYASPWNNVFYANLNVSVYGINMPFSLYYTNDNTSFNHPHFTFSFNPRYKNWTGSIGRSSMPFSNYVMNMSYNGVGVEYTDKKWRFGAFYGSLRSPINDNPSDPLARSPQYRRIGWGFKVGYGSGTNYIDLYMLRAYDRVGSIDEHWRSYVSPQENLVIGLKGGIAPIKPLTLNFNVASSILSTDKQAQKVETDAADNWSGIFQARYSTLARFAGDVSANLVLPGITASAYYRMIQPDYNSLGTYYMANNYQSLGLTATTHLFKKVSLSANFSGQEDNLTNKQLYTTRGLVYSANASTRFGNLNLNLGYNGYTQKQFDGTVKVNDTTRVNRLMQSLTFSPSYNIDGTSLTHSMSLSASYTENKDKNKFSTHVGDIKSLALGASYNLGVKDWEMDFTGNINHQTSKGLNNRYTSDVASLTASRSFLKDKSLSVSATLSLIYNEIQYQSKSLSIAGDMQVGYTLNQKHIFSLSAGISKYGDVNPTRTRSTLDATNVNVSFNYNYAFTLLEIKKKAKQAMQKEK